MRLSSPEEGDLRQMGKNIMLGGRVRAGGHKLRSARDARACGKLIYQMRPLSTSSHIGNTLDSYSSVV